MRRLKRGSILLAMLMVLLLSATMPDICRSDLQEVKQSGVLRHLGVTYAHFVRKTPTGHDGLDVEVMQLFAKHLGVKYEFVPTTWPKLFTDLTGRRLNPKTGNYDEEATLKIKGDMIANGLTVLPNRQKIVDYSIPTFPTGVWLIGPATSSISPIDPSGNLAQDIEKVNGALNHHSVLVMKNTCLDVRYFSFDPKQVKVKNFTGSKIIRDIVPAMLRGEADATLLDIPDALVTLQEKAGDIKIIGPVSPAQIMGAAVAKNSPELLKAYNDFFRQIWNDRTYYKLVEKYYPSVFLYFDDFFRKTY